MDGQDGQDSLTLSSSNTKQLTSMQAVDKPLNCVGDRLANALMLRIGIRNLLILSLPAWHAEYEPFRRWSVRMLA